MGGEYDDAAMMNRSMMNHADGVSTKGQSPWIYAERLMITSRSATTIRSHNNYAIMIDYD